MKNWLKDIKAERNLFQVEAQISRTKWGTREMVNVCININIIFNFFK